MATVLKGTITKVVNVTTSGCHDNAGLRVRDNFIVDSVQDVEIDVARELRNGVLIVPRMLTEEADDLDRQRKLRHEDPGHLRA